MPQRARLETGLSHKVAFATRPNDTDTQPKCEILALRLLLNRTPRRLLPLLPNIYLIFAESALSPSNGGAKPRPRISID
jgi:hypothetical protein